MSSSRFRIGFLVAIGLAALPFVTPATAENPERRTVVVPYSDLTTFEADAIEKRGGNFILTGDVKLVLDGVTLLGRAATVKSEEKLAVVEGYSAPARVENSRPKSTHGALIR